MTDNLTQCRSLLTCFFADCDEVGTMGYGPRWALEYEYWLPHEEAFTQIWPHYLRLSADERLTLRSDVDGNTTFKLFAYAARNATMAVRYGDPVLLWHALLAVTLADPSTDDRDFWCVMPLFRDAATRIDARSLLDDAQAIVPVDTRKHFYAPPLDSIPTDHPGSYMIADPEKSGFRYIHQ